MRNGISVDYVYDAGDLDQRPLSGVDRKVMMQVSCFERQGLECRLRVPCRSGGIATMLQCFPFLKDRTRWETVINVPADVIYVRRPVYFSKQFIDWLSRIKRLNPQTVILLEIPTYPYDKELQRLKYYPIFAKDRLHRGSLRRCINAIVSMVSVDEIFGIPNIRIFNGIDLSAITTRTNSLNSEELNIICVASFEKWHGIDRIINGMHDYYKHNGKREIVLHLLGNGSELDNLKKLTDRLNLNRHVRFYGQCERAQMDEVYNKCTIAVECLGIHRKTPGGISSSLKSREYLAKGIPFVHSSAIDVFEEESVDFCLKVPPNDDPLNIQSIVDFHDALYAKYEEMQLIEMIRDYAKNHVSMDATMKPLINYINKEVKVNQSLK